MPPVENSPQRARFLGLGHSFTMTCPRLVPLLTEFSFGVEKCPLIQWEHMVKIAGGIVWNPKLGIVVVNQNHNSWSLPKGHVEPGEEILRAAMREIREETGIPESALSFLGELATYQRDRIQRDPGDTPEMREITLFLFKTTHEKLAPQDPMNPEARWVPIGDVSSLLTHPKDQAMFESLKKNIRVEFPLSPREEVLVTG